VPETTKTGFAVSANLTGHAICHYGGNCTKPQPCSCVSPYGNPLFSTPKPQLWSPRPQICPQSLSIHL